MRFPAFAIIFAVTVPVVHAQEISVPSVTTAKPGGYANPLQLDTDKYKRAKAKSQRSSVLFGHCNGKPLTKAARGALESGYITRAKGNERQGARWLRVQCGPKEAWKISRVVQKRGAVR